MPEEEQWTSARMPANCHQRASLRRLQRPNVSPILYYFVELKAKRPGRVSAYFKGSIFVTRAAGEYLDSMS